MADGVATLVFNGDTLDTRPGPYPSHTAACLEQVRQFIATAQSTVTLLTGNHDPDVSDQHSLNVADGRVLVVHGDVLFEDMVPWGRDARFIRSQIAEALGPGASTRISHMPFERRMELWRHVARATRQRHQAEPNVMKYALRLALDTVWPPTRFFEIFGAWRREPLLAAELVRAHHPTARYVLVGHTHRPAIRSVEGGPTVINTGAFTAPFGGFVVDIDETTLRVKRVERRGGEFRPGALVAEFPLAT